MRGGGGGGGAACAKASPPPNPLHPPLPRSRTLQVILYPQSGGFLERNETSAPSPQLQGGCFDGYGQTRSDYAYSSGPQIATLRNMNTAML